MFVPIIIPTQTGIPVCPECGKLENVINVCKHCGHEYKDKKWSISFTIFFCICVFIGIYLVVMTIGWLFKNGIGYNISFLEMLLEQWDFIRNLRIF